MVLGTYANLNAIDEKNSGSFEETDHILNHAGNPIEQPAMNLSKHIENILHLHDVTPSNLESDLKRLPDTIESLPKEPEPMAVDGKYHESPVEGLKLIDDTKKDVAAGIEVKLIPLDVASNDQPVVKAEDSKKSNDINKEAIQKEEQEIAIEKKEKVADDSNSELKRLEETKKLLQEVKEIIVMEKQNQEKQQLVLQKFDEIVDKVEKIEKVQEEDSKKHEEEKAEKKLLDEQKAAENIPVKDVLLEKVNDEEDKNVNIQQPNIATNQTMNGPIISMLINKHANQVDPATNNSQESNPNSNVKATQGSKEAVPEHAAIQRDLLNVPDTTDQTAIIADDNVAQADFLRHKRAIELNENCEKTVLSDVSMPLMSENGKNFRDVSIDLVGTIVGRDLKSVQDKEDDR